MRLLAFSAAVLICNNLAILWTGQEPERRALLDGARLFGCAGVLAWSLWVEKLTLEELGFSATNLGRSLGWGLMVGVAMALPSLLFFAFPLISPRPVQYAGYANLDLGGLLLMAFVRLPLGTALFEETLFRGLIQARAVSWLGPARGIALSVVLFIFWHTVITYEAIGQTNLTSAALPVPVLYLLAAVPLGGAGVVFSLIRHASGNLAGAILAHWLVNVLMLVFLFLQASSAG